MNSEFCAGYARTDITPQESVPLAGYGNTLTRMSQGALESLMATCLAVTDEKENTILLFSLDIVSTRDAYCLAAREQISKRYGIPIASIVLVATHTHSAPDMAQKDFPAIQRYSGGMASSSASASAGGQRATVTGAASSAVGLPQTRSSAGT